uniref:Uncharacterized protein n=1 Tax=Avena sativa TaxID=4498 RepID=A0ACD5W3B9_AVESA
MAPAVKVYGWAMSPFVARALLCLEEAGVEYELVPMIPEAGDHLRPDFLAKNPFGQVPVLEDGDLTLFESRAIARHVLRKYKPELLAGDGSPAAAAMVDVWLEVEAQQHHAPTGAIMLQCIVVPLRGGVRDQAVVDENVAKLRKVLEVYEARLSASRYLAGESLTLADLSHFPMMRYFMDTEYKALVEALPHVKAWWEELKARPAARKVTELGVQSAERWAQEKGRAAVNQ